MLAETDAQEMASAETPGTQHEGDERYEQRYYHDIGQLDACLQGFNILAQPVLYLTQLGAYGEHLAAFAFEFQTLLGAQANLHLHLSRGWVSLLVDAFEFVYARAGGRELLAQ